VTLNCREKPLRKVFSRLARMRQVAVLTLALALGTASALALVSCGGEDAQLLPGSTAEEINENLDTVRLLADEGECVGAADAAVEVSAQIDSLGNVDAKLKQALERGAERLNEVVTTCDEATTEEFVPPVEETTTEETTKVPPGQEKKAEKEREKEEKELEKEEEKAAKEQTTPAETTPEETSPVPPSEGGASGGVSPGAPVEPGGEGEG
jgi:hypothetical protein